MICLVMKNTSQRYAANYFKMMKDNRTYISFAYST